MSSSAFIRKNFRRTVLASFVAIGAFVASSSFATNGSTTITDTVIQANSMKNPFDLDFGQVAEGSAVPAALFNVTSAADANYNIVWTDDEALTNPVSTETMAIVRISGLDSTEVLKMPPYYRHSFLTIRRSFSA